MGSFFKCLHDGLLVEWDKLLRAGPHTIWGANATETIKTLHFSRVKGEGRITVATGTRH